MRRSRGRRGQVATYNRGLRLFGNQTVWMSIIDVDEFIVPVAFPTIPELLAEFEDQGALYMRWRIYGSSGHVTKTKGLVIERFRCHADLYDKNNGFQKFIVRPDRCRYLHFHFAKFWEGFHAVDAHHQLYTRSLSADRCHDRIRVNHYNLKSQEEFKIKMKRGYPDGIPVPTMRYFFRLDRNINNVRNSPDMDKYVPIVKDRIRKRFGLPDSDDSMW